MQAMHHAAMFLIHTLCDLYLWLVLLRIILPWVNADYYHPFSQLVLTATNRPTALLSYLFPKSAFIDYAALALLISVDLVKLWLLIIIQYQWILPNPVGLSIMVMADVCDQILSLYFFIILGQIILSWVSQGYHPMADMLNRLASPIMEPIQKRMPPIAGFDLSPIPVMLTLKLLAIAVTQPLMHWGSLHL